MFADVGPYPSLRSRAAGVHGFLGGIGIETVVNGDWASAFGQTTLVGCECAPWTYRADRSHEHHSLAVGQHSMMLRFKADFPANGTILCLGAHCDDIEIGCGGTLIELHERHPELNFVWVVFSADAVREQETRTAAAALFGARANVAVSVYNFRGSYFPYCGADIKDAFEELRSRVAPDLVLTHYLADRHQDHRLIAELTWNTFRSHAILEYEIPKYDADLTQPGVYCPLSMTTVDRKIATLMQCFPSQRGRHWFDAELFRGHLRLRGVECNSTTRYAEAFHGRKLVLY